MRPRFYEEPTSRLAAWSRRIAVFSLPVMLLAILIVRSDLLALGAFVVIWTDGLRGLGQAVLALFIGTAMLAYPAYFAVIGYRLPMLTDITTDFVDPPRFETIARLRPRTGNPIVYPGLHAAELQRAAYPDIEPVVVGATPKEAYEAAITLINKRKWRLISLRAPEGGRRDGLIEAVARTPIMGFRDDVVVRVRPDEGGARVDMRSASRYGRGDFGTNAARIRKFMNEIDDFISTQKENLKKLEQKAKDNPVVKKPQPAAR
jgi:uncharacterized protein (DUF1499 family)